MIDGQVILNKLDSLIAEKKRSMEKEPNMGALPWNCYLGQLIGWEIAQDIIFHLMEQGEESLASFVADPNPVPLI
jgi:hypothetical protein